MAALPMELGDIGLQLYGLSLSCLDDLAGISPGLLDDQVPFLAGIVFYLFADLPGRNQGISQFPLRPFEFLDSLRLFMILFLQPVVLPQQFLPFVGHKVQKIIHFDHVKTTKFDSELLLLNVQRSDLHEFSPSLPRPSAGLQGGQAPLRCGIDV